MGHRDSQPLAFQFTRAGQIARATDGARLGFKTKVHDDNYQAEELLRGWGVRFSFTGHDLHGLTLGPDGRLYFSVGDRGTHVVTREGKTINLPDEGAVFRCEPDVGDLKSDAADAILTEALDKLMRREVAPEVTLELVEAAAKRFSDAVKSRLTAYQNWKLPQDHLTPYREALVGGDPVRGRKIFCENAAVTCTRCHQIGTDSGGNAGPKLDGLATRAVREHLLESVVFPNQQITSGYEAALITRKNGDTVNEHQ